MIQKKNPNFKSCNTGVGGGKKIDCSPLNHNGPPGSICVPSNGDFSCVFNNTGMSVCKNSPMNTCDKDSPCSAGDTCVKNTDDDYPFKSQHFTPGACVIMKKELCEGLSQLPYVCEPGEENLYDTSNLRPGKQNCSPKNSPVEQCKQDKDCGLGGTCTVMSKNNKEKQCGYQYSEWHSAEDKKLPSGTSVYRRRRRIVFTRQLLTSKLGGKSRKLISWKYRCWRIYTLSFCL